MFGTMFGRYAARAPSALPQFRTFGTRLGSTSHVLSGSGSNSNSSSTHVASTTLHSTQPSLPSGLRSLHTTPNLFEQWARRRVRRNSDASLSSFPTDPTPHLFIGNLPLQITEEEIRSFVTDVAKIENFTLRMHHGSEGEFRGIAFLDFSSSEAANDAMERIQNAEHNLGDIMASFSKGPKKRDIIEHPTMSVFVGFENVISEEDLRAYLSAFEGLREIRLAVGAWDNRSRAFVDFDSVEAAQKVQKALAATETIPSSNGPIPVARCNFARERKDLDRTPAQPTDRLYIRGLPSRECKDELMEIFGDYEGFNNLFVSNPGSSQQGKWAIAYYNTVGQATKAYESVQGQSILPQIKVKYGTSRTPNRTFDSRRDRVFA